MKVEGGPRAHDRRHGTIWSDRDEVVDPSTNQAELEGHRLGPDTAVATDQPFGGLLGLLVESLDSPGTATRTRGGFNLTCGCGCTLSLQNQRIRRTGADVLGVTCTCVPSTQCDVLTGVLDLLDPFAAQAVRETIKAAVIRRDEMPAGIREPGQHDDDRQFEKAVAAEVHRRRVRDEADARVRAERAADIEMPEVVGLEAFLAKPDPEEAYLIDGVWPAESNVMLAAQEKSGKSTLMSNLIRALVDGDDFLGAFPVAETVDRVILLDAELSERMLRRWLREQGIDRDHAVAVASIRGRVSAFDIIDPATRTRWAAMIGPADVLIVDCLRPIVDALGLDENRDGSKVMSALTELCAEAGIAQWVLVHHTGHGGERARGDSGLLGTADILWRVLREDPDKAMPQPTYFTAFGRDVDVPESLLAYDPARRRLTVAGGGRKVEKAARHQADLIDALRTVEMSGVVPPPWNTETIGASAGMSRGDVRAGRKAAVAAGDLIVSKGDRNAVLHALSDTGRGLNPPVRRSPP